MRGSLISGRTLKEEILSLDHELIEHALKLMKEVLRAPPKSRHKLSGTTLHAEYEARRLAQKRDFSEAAPTEMSRANPLSLSLSRKAHTLVQVTTNTGT